MPEPIGVVTLRVEPDMGPMQRSLAAFASEGSKTMRNAFSLQPLGRITGQANEFQKSLAASNARVIAFGASAGSIMLVKRAFDKLVESTIGVERQLADINSLFQMSGSRLQAFSNQLFQIANGMSVSFEDAAKAASVFAHHGLTVEETLKRTASALALSRLSSMGYEESVLSLTSIINSFTKESLDATDVVDKLTAVGGKYAASSDEIAEALKRVAAAANDANVSFEQTVGLVTAAQQITSRGGAVIGNALKSIFTRLQRPKVLDDLESMGLAMRDAQGKILPMVQSLRNLANGYDSLSASQRSFVSETVGGVYQINVLKAILHDVSGGVSVFEGAMNAAANATGTAERRMKTLNDTLSSQLVRTMNELTRASSNIGQNMLGEGMRGGIGGIEKILKSLADISDSNATKQGSVAKQATATIFQGALKGVGNILEGPGVQFIVYTLLKLFERLEKFVVDSAKDVTGLNSKEKERAAINASVADFLSKQKDTIEQIIHGQKSVTDLTKEYVDHLSKATAKAEVLAMLQKNITDQVVPQISIKTSGGMGFAYGYRPMTEAEGARQGGYNAGRVVETTVRNGSGADTVVANTAETKASIMQADKVYDFINPPKNSRAGFMHREKSLQTLGIDPYKLPQQPVAAGGSIPAPSYVKGLGGEQQYVLPSGGAISYFESPKDLSVHWTESKNKGEGFALFQHLAMQAKLKGKTLSTGELKHQLDRIDQMSPSVSNYENLLKIWPQLRYREIPGLTTSGSASIRLGAGRKNFKFASLDELKDNVNTLEAQEVIKNIERSSIKGLTSRWAAMGAVPNLNADEIEKRLADIGLGDWRTSGGLDKAAMKGGGLDWSFNYIPEEVHPQIMKFINFFAGRPDAKPTINSFLQSLTRKANTPDSGKQAVKNYLMSKSLNMEDAAFTTQFGVSKKEAQERKDFEWRRIVSDTDPTAWYKHLRGAPTETSNMKAGAYDKFYYRTQEGDLRLRDEMMGELIKALTGTFYTTPREERLRKADAAALPFDVADKIVQRYANQIKVMTAYKSLKDLRVGDTGTITSEIKSMQGGTFKFTNEMFSHPTILKEKLADVRAMFEMITEGEGMALENTNFAPFLGSALDQLVKNRSAKTGTRVSQTNAALDILGDDPELRKLFNIKGDVAAWEVKSSEEEATTPRMIGMKVLKSLVGDPRSYLKGPESEVPLLKSVPQFNPSNKSVGLLDYDRFGDDRNQFYNAVAKVIAEGKPLKIFHGGRGSGTTTAGLNQASGVVKSIDDIGNFDQFIMTSSHRESLSRGIPGLAFSAASNVEEFSFLPPDTEEREKKRHALARSYLAKKLGNRFSLYQYAMGAIPNLVNVTGNRYRIYRSQFNQAIIDAILSRAGGAGQQNLITSTVHGSREQLLERASAEELRALASLSTIPITGQNLNYANIQGTPMGNFPVTLGVNAPVNGSTLPLTVISSIHPQQLGRDLYSRYGIGTREGSGVLLHSVLTRNRDQMGRLVSHGPSITSPPRWWNAGNRMTKDNIEIVDTARAMKLLGLAGGGIPDALIAEGSDYVPLAKSNSLQLRMVASAYGIDATQNPVHILEQLSNLQPEIFKKMWMKGLVDFPQVAEAMKAENKATNGHAVLSSSSLLRSFTNPLGLAAIDSRNQSSADEAIMQHAAMGETMSQIKVKRSAGGKVPNLVLGGDSLLGGSGITNSILLAMGQYGGELLQTLPMMDGFKKSLGNLISEGERATIHLRELDKSYEKARDTLLQFPNKPVSWKTPSGEEKMFTSNKELEEYKIGATKDLRAKVSSYQSQKEEDNRQASALGRRLAIYGNLAGGVATSIGQRFSPNAGATMDELTQGLSMAGQSLMAFPGAMGKIMAIGASAAYATSALDIWGKGLAQARANYDVSNSKFQKLSAQIDSLSTSLSNYDALIMDQNVSYETLIREQRKYMEVMGQMSQTSEGSGALSRLVGAPDTATKVARLAEYKAEQSREMDRQSSLLSTREYAARRTFNFFGKTIGSSALGFSNEAERNEAGQLIRGNAATAISSLDTDSKNALMALANTPDKFNEAFQSMASNQDSAFGNFLSSLESIVGKQNMPQIVQAIRKSLATEQSITSPAGRALVAGLHERNAERQLSLDAAIRKEASTRRQFVNQGALAGSNQLDIMAMLQRSQFGATNVALSKAQSLTGLVGAQFGERTVREYTTNIELQRIEAERRNKASNVAIQSTRGITDLVTQNFDEYLKHTDLTKQLGPAGQTNIANLPQFKVNLIEALNKGVAGTVAGGTFDRFRNAGGSLDQQKLIEEIAKNSGADTKTQQGVLDFLRNNNTVEILKNMQNANSELVNINQEAYEESQKQTDALNAFKQEMRFKEMASYLGGIRNLLDRGSRRAMEREVVKSAALLQRGSTAEIRGMGGAGLLDFFKKNNVPIDLSGKSPLSQLMIKAWDAAGAGLKESQQKSMGRILGISSSIAGPEITKGLAAYASTAGNAQVEAALKSEYKPESEGFAQGQMDQTTKGIKDALDVASGNVYNFGRSLDITGKQLMAVVNDVATMRKNIDAAMKGDERRVQRQLERQNRGEVEGAPNTPKRVFRMSDFNPFHSTTGESLTPEEISSQGGSQVPWEAMIPHAAGAAVQMAGLALLLGRRGRGGGGGENGPSLFSRAKDYMTTFKSDRLSKSLGSLRGPQMTEEAYESWMKARELNPSLTFEEHMNPRTPTRITGGYVGGTKRGYGGVIQEAMAKSQQAQRVASAELSAIMVGKSRGNEKRAMSEYERYVQATNNPSLNPIEHGELPPEKLDREQRRRRYSPRNPASRTARAANAYYGAPALGFVGGFNGGFAGGGGIGNGMMGGIGGMAGQMLSMHAMNAMMEGNYSKGGAMMAGSMALDYLPQIMSARGTGAIGGMLRAGGFGIGSRALGLGGGLMAGGVGGALGTVGLAAGAAYGGWKIGQYGYQKLSGVGALTAGITEGNQSGLSKDAAIINKMISKGKSTKEIEAYISTQIQSTKNQLADARGGTLTKVFGTNATGMAGIEKSLQETLEQLQVMKENVGGAKEAYDQQHKEERQNDRLIAALEKIASGTGGGAGGEGSVESSVKVEISLKDSNIPEQIANKIVDPLRNQLNELQSRVNIIANRIAPQPAKVG